MTNGETRLRELVAAMEHRVKSSMLEQALASPVQAEVGCRLCAEGMPLKKYWDGTMRHFDGLMAWHPCGPVQAEVGAGERALAQRIIDLPCIVEVRGPDVVGQIGEQLAGRPEVGTGACILTCRKCGIEYDIRSKGADRDFHSGLCYNAYHADGQADEAARQDVAGGGMRETLIAPIECLIAFHEKEAKDHVSSQWIYGNHMMAVKAYRKVLEMIAKLADDSPAPVTDEHPYYSKGTMQALHRAMAESEKEGSK